MELFSIKDVTAALAGFRLGRRFLWAVALFSSISTSFGAAPVITNISLVPRLTIHSDLGITNQIQYSADLAQTNWTALTNLVITQSPYWFVDVAAPPASQRFYRVLGFATNNPVPTNMVLIPAGTFTMGNSMAADTGYPAELPLHTINVSAFYIEKYEVTKALWDEVYQWTITHGYDFQFAAGGKAPNHPAVSMSWSDAVKWCNARSEKEGRVPAYYTSPAQTEVYRTGVTNQLPSWVKWNAGYRLPTEAEWEKAARGGASGRRFAWADADTIAHSRANYNSDWFNGQPYYSYDVSLTSGFHPTFNDGARPYSNPVGYFAPNGYGLYDMTGNVWEWCWDIYLDSYYASSPVTDPLGPPSGLARIKRGGSYQPSAPICRVSYRGALTYSNKSDDLGFRCVLPLVQP